MQRGKNEVQLHTIMIQLSDRLKCRPHMTISNHRIEEGKAILGNPLTTLFSLSSRLRSPMQIQPFCVYRAEKHQGIAGNVVIKRRSAPRMQAARYPTRAGKGLLIRVGRPYGPLASRLTKPM